MTDRNRKLTVVLEEDMRVDDVAELVSAIRQMRRVVAVGVDVSDPRDYAAEERARADITKRVWDALRSHT